MVKLTGTILVEGLVGEGRTHLWIVVDRVDNQVKFLRHRTGIPTACVDLDAQRSVEILRRCSVECAGGRIENQPGGGGGDPSARVADSVGVLPKKSV